MIPECFGPSLAAGWQVRCGIQKVRVEDGHSGVACLAMVAGLNYQEASEVFVSTGLGIRRRGRPAFSTNCSEMRMAVGAAGLIQQARRWQGWSNFQGLGILKVKDDWRGEEGAGRWHWVTAFRHPEFEIVVFDPFMEFPAFKRMPLDELCTRFDLYEPKGQWLQVEQRFSLAY
ncbi:hypothetical protein FA336_13860 [Pseudomonas aeruginosa]|nr:hypothetical protein [Pseudomonas aeruginosa]